MREETTTGDQTVLVTFGLRWCHCGFHQVWYFLPNACTFLWWIKTLLFLGAAHERKPWSHFLQVWCSPHWPRSSVFLTFWSTDWLRSNIQLYFSVLPSTLLLRVSANAYIGQWLASISLKCKDCLVAAASSPVYSKFLQRDQRPRVPLCKNGSRNPIEAVGSCQ